MKRRGIAALGAAFTLNLIAGCATNTPANGSKDLKNTEKNEAASVSGAHSGPYSGRLSLQIEPEAGSSLQAQSFSGSFELRGDPEIGELDLLTPLGQIVMQLRWQPDIAVILRGNQRQLFANAQDLIQQATGASLSLEQLFSWIQGKEAQANSDAKEAARGAAWQVDLSSHAQGRIIARRSQPTPAVLRIALEMP
jgi:outer membrane lipoprotein LolB